PLRRLRVTLRGSHQRPFDVRLRVDREVILEIRPGKLRLLLQNQRLAMEFFQLRPFSLAQTREGLREFELRRQLPPAVALPTDPIAVVLPAGVAGRLVRLDDTRRASHYVRLVRSRIKIGRASCR